MQNDPHDSNNLDGFEPDALAARLESLQHGGEEGFYDPKTDIHLFDYMGYLADDLSAPAIQSASDVLVAAAAWIIDPAETGAIKRWLARLKQQPEGWLTPWRVGEPYIVADLTLDTPPENFPREKTYVIARLNNGYLHGDPVLNSITRAIDRFQDLRKAIEPEMNQILHTPARRATRLWLSSLDETADTDILEDE